MNARNLAVNFIVLTDEMAAMKRVHRARRKELARKYEEDLAALKAEERALSMRRAQIALRMTQTGHNLDELGRMVGVSGPFMCQLARKAREENTDG